MSNTVLVKGKGMAAGIMLEALRRWHQYTKLTQHDPKWWQLDVRYELRLQNLDSDQIHHLRLLLPESKFKIEVF